jgi:hypothetical protein
MKTVLKRLIAGGRDARCANATMSMRERPKRAVVAPIMVGDGDFNRWYDSAKSLFSWVLPGRNLCGGAQRGTSLASGPSAYLTAA